MPVAYFLLRPSRERLNEALVARSLAAPGAKKERCAPGSAATSDAVLSR